MPKGEKKEEEEFSPLEDKDKGAKSDETPQQRFERMMNSRVRNVLIALKRVSHLSGGGYKHEGHIERYNAVIEELTAKVAGMKVPPRWEDSDIEFDVNSVAPPPPSQ